jgi:hypothetical protein
MVDHGISELLGRRGRALLRECKRLVPSFRIGIEEMRVGPAYVWRMRVDGKEYAEAIRVRDCGRTPRLAALTAVPILPRTVGDDIEVLLVAARECIRDLLGL